MSSRLPLRYLAGSISARFADEGVAVTVALLALDRTGSAAPAAAVVACWLAPHIIVAPLVGAYASRANRVTRFYAVALTVFGAAIAAVVMMLGRAPLVAVLAVAVLGGCAGPVASGGLSSLVAGLVPESSRQRAYALDAAGYTVAVVAGPAVATAISVAVSPSASGVVLAAAALVAAGLVVTLPAAAAGRSAESRLIADVVSGLAVIWRRRPLRAVTAATCVAYLGIGALTVTAVLVAGQWGRPSDGGFLVTGFAVGGLAGALALARWPRPVRPEHLAGACLLVTGIALVGAAAFSSLAPCLVLFVAAGVGDGPLLTATLQVRAAHAPAEVRAQVFTTGAALKLTAASLGAALVGLATSLPPALPLLLIATTQLVGFGLLATTLATAPREGAVRRR